MTTTDPAGSGATRSGRAGGALRLALQLLLTAVVTAFILQRIGFTLDELTGLGTDRWQPRILPLLGSLVVLLAGYWMSAVLWARMVVEMGGPRLSPWVAVRLYMVANLGRYVPGKVVQIAGLAWLARSEGVPAGLAVGAAVVGQGMALLGAFIVGLGAFFGTEDTYRWVGWWGLGVAVVVIAATSVPASAQVLERLWRRLAGGRGGEAANDADAPLATVRAGFGGRWALLYALNWGLYAVAFWLLFLGLEGWAPFLWVGPAFAAAYLVGYVVLIAPAGVGIRESALVVFLLPVLPREGALALALVARLWTTVAEVVPAAVFAWIQTRSGPPPSNGPPQPTDPDPPAR